VEIALDPDAFDVLAHIVPPGHLALDPIARAKLRHVDPALKDEELRVVDDSLVARLQADADRAAGQLTPAGDVEVRIVLWRLPVVPSGPLALDVRVIAPLRQTDQASWR
jgi:hypothetical protein